MNNIHVRKLQKDIQSSILDFIKKFEIGESQFNFNTSGSTGNPKNILISREKLIISAKMTGFALHLKPTYTVLNCLNTDFIAGKMMLVRSLVLNMTCIVVPPTSDPLENMLDDIDFAGFVPLQLYTMLTNDKKSERITKLNSMKVIIVGGDSISNQLLGAMQQIKTPIYHTYGMTETVSHVALKLLNGVNKQNCFEVLEGVKIKIDDRNCLQILSPTSGKQWINSNDMVELIDETHFNWLGRIDNVIISGGIKIAVENVEKKICEYLQAQNLDINLLVTSIPHAALGQELILLIEDEINIKKVIDLNILENLTDILPKYHTPKKIFSIAKFVNTANGKINRKETTLVLIKNLKPLNSQ